MLTDPIADMLTRLRNGSAVNHRSVTIPYSKLKKSVLDLMVVNKIIEKVETVKDGTFPELKANLLADKKLNIKRISKPGQRIYVKSSEIRPVRNGLGISILSTPSGILTNREAVKQKVGGELICEVY